MLERWKHVIISLLSDLTYSLSQDSQSWRMLLKILLPVLPTWLGIPLSCWLSCGIWLIALGVGLLTSRVIFSQNVLIELTNPFSLSRVICLHPQTGQSPLAREWGGPPWTCGHRPTVYSPQFGLLVWSWFYLSEHRLISIFSISEGLCRFIWFSCLSIQNVRVGKPPSGGFFHTLKSYT